MMQKLIEGFGTQVQKAIQIGQAQALQMPSVELRNVVVAGLGGSGIGATLVSSLLADTLKLPFYITKSYDIPAFVNEHTLFIASSFSGGTEETLSALDSALQRGAHINCISSGGRILDIARQKGLNAVQIPNEAPCPRAFLGYSFVQILYVLHHHGLIDKSFEQQLQASVKRLDESLPEIQQEAKALAALFQGKIPIIYADHKWEAVIVRLQQQINENAKQLCHVNVFPEMNHNELVGWQLPESYYAQTAVLMLRSNYDHPRVSLRMDICKPIFEAKTRALRVLSPQGSSFLEQSLYLIHLFDWTSLYLAELNGVDAFPVDIIFHLKDELAKV